MLVIQSFVQKSKARTRKARVGKFIPPERDSEREGENSDWLFSLLKESVRKNKSKTASKEVKTKKSNASKKSKR